MSDDVITEMDMGVSTIVRINYELWRCNQFSFNDNITGWFKTLKTLYKELIPFMTEKEGRLHSDILNEIEKEYRNYLKFLNKAEFVKVKTKRIIMPPRKVFDLLQEWEIELRKIMDKKGLLMKKQPEMNLDDF